jgi:hypothetical protein
MLALLGVFSNARLVRLRKRRPSCPEWETPPMSTGARWKGDARQMAINTTLPVLSGNGEKSAWLLRIVLAAMIRTVYGHNAKTYWPRRRGPDRRQGSRVVGTGGVLRTGPSLVPAQLSHRPDGTAAGFYPHCMRADWHGWTYDIQLSCQMDFVESLRIKITIPQTLPFRHPTRYATPFQRLASCDSNALQIVLCATLRHNRHWNCEPEAASELIDSGQ